MFNVLQELSQKDRERIKQKALKELLPKFQKVKGITKTLDKAIRRTIDISSLLECLITLQRTQFANVYTGSCYACEKSGHNALLAIRCGGCDKQYWVNQSEVRSRWCLYCDNKSLWSSWWAELRQVTGILDIEQALTIFESPEQKLLALWRWDAEHHIHRLKSQQKTQIIAYKCTLQLAQKTIENFNAAWLEFQGDPDIDFNQRELAISELETLIQQCKIECTQQ